MRDQPRDLPNTQPNGAPLKPMTQVVLERRATPHFQPDEVPKAFLDAMLELGAQAPSGYNIQPWRFIVVRDEERLERYVATVVEAEALGFRRAFRWKGSGDGRETT